MGKLYIKINIKSYFYIKWLQKFNQLYIIIL